MEVSVVTVLGSYTETPLKEWIEKQDVYLDEDIAQKMAMKLKSEYENKDDEEGIVYRVVVNRCGLLGYYE